MNDLLLALGIIACAVALGILGYITQKGGPIFSREKFGVPEFENPPPPPPLKYEPLPMPLTGLEYTPLPMPLPGQPHYIMGVDLPKHNSKDEAGYILYKITHMGAEVLLSKSSREMKSTKELYEEAKELSKIFKAKLYED